MNRNTIFLAVLAFVLVGVATPFELFGVPLAPIVAVIMGAAAGWYVAATHRQGLGDSAGKAGAVVGLGALLGSIIGLSVLGLWLGNIPEVQAFVQNSEPHPEARIPSDWVAPLGALAGVVIGLVVGLFDLILSWVAGLVAGAIYGQGHARA